MKSLILALTILAAQQSFAAPATSYLCEGQNKVTGKTVAFEVLFADHDREAGYTDQSITVTKEDKSTVIFQMFGANRSNHCKTGASGEIFLAKSFKMDSDAQGVTMEFKIDCGKDLNYDVKGRCARGY